MKKLINIKEVINAKNTDLEDLMNILNQVCLQVAQHFSLYDQYGKPRMAYIIDVIANSTCTACIVNKFSNKKVGQEDIDALYRECHKLAVNILVEELYNVMSEMGYKVIIETEANLAYGRADIIMAVTSYGVNLKTKSTQLMVEVKTGSSLSLSQLFRYLLDERSDAIVVWRVRRRQVLVFNVKEIRPLLTEFMRMTCLRATRLLSSQQIRPCQHTKILNHQPSQEELEKTLKDFSESLIETLPKILQMILKQLEIVFPCEQGENCDGEERIEKG